MKGKNITAKNHHLKWKRINKWWDEELYSLYQKMLINHHTYKESPNHITESTYKAFKKLFRNKKNGKSKKLKRKAMPT